MDIKPVVARIASDCDLRKRFVRSVPTALDNYFLSGSGELLTKKELETQTAFNYLLDGLDFVAGQVARV
jgi:hypothetical protein